MAQSSGSFRGSINNGYQRLVVYWSSSQSIENNTSTITCDMYLESDGSIYIGARDNTTTIDGNVKAYSSGAIQVTGSFTRYLGSVSQTIQHDDYGNKTFSMSSVFNIQATLSGTYYSSINASSGNIELPNIPRASTITVNDANIGSSTTININKKVGSFTTNLYWRVKGDNNWTYIDNTNQYSYGWTVPTSLYQRTQNSKTIKCEFLARTLSGSTTIGDKTTEATFTATGDPVINSVTIIDVNQDTIDLTEDSTKLVMYQSTAKVSVDVSPQNSASISSVKVNSVSATYNSTSEKWEIEMQNVTTNQFLVDVADSRGYPSPPNPQTYSATKIDYIPLTINGTITRNQPTDGKVNISINGNYFNGSFSSNNDNDLIVQYRYVEYGGDISQESWVDLTPTITNNTYNLTTQISNIDYTKQYEFQIQAYDLLQTNIVTGIQVPKGKPVFNWGEDYFNVNGTLKVNDNAILTNLFPVGSIYMSVVNTNPSNYFGGTWVAWGSGRVPVGVDTSQSEFDTVEETGGSKSMQQHSHTGSTSYVGDHTHQIGGDWDVVGGGNYTSVHNAGYPGNSVNPSTSGAGGHSHTFTTDNAGTGNSGNLQPYITCYMWKRTA